MGSFRGRAGRVGCLFPGNRVSVSYSEVSGWVVSYSEVTCAVSYAKVSEMGCELFRGE